MKASSSIPRRSGLFSTYVDLVLAKANGLLSRQPAFSPESFSPALQAASAEPVALLIDGDNISPELIEPILSEAQKLGKVTIKRVYGGCNSLSHKWCDVGMQHGLKQFHLPPANKGKNGNASKSKNAADIALTVDAMYLLHRGACKHFCIVSSDSDFTPLIHHLREEGCQVLGIGEKNKCPLSLQNACTRFITLDSPNEHNASENASETTSSEEPIPIEAAPSHPASISTLLRKAYEDALRGKEGDWVLISAIGLSLKKVAPQFDVKPYAKDLTSLIGKYNEVFELHQRSNGHWEMRLKKAS
jgi:uncharacterized LabA/DUF88 family protein